METIVLAKKPGGIIIFDIVLLIIQLNFRSAILKTSNNTELFKQQQNLTTLYPQLHAKKENHTNIFRSLILA